METDLVAGVHFLVLSQSFHKLGKNLTHGVDVDIHAVVEEDELVGSIHQNAEVFDPKAEYAFQCEC